MRAKPENLVAELARGLSPVYLVAGDELLLVQEAVDSIRVTAREKGFSERIVLVADRSFNWLELAHANESQSLFAEGKIIELRLPTGKPGKEGSQAIVDYLASDHAANVLLVSSSHLDKARAKAKWVTSLEKAGVFVQIWPVKPHELPGWIRSRMQRVGLTPDPDAVQMLADRLEGNLLAAQQEIDKLVLLKGSGSVSVDDVRECVADSARFDVFRLIECASLGQAAHALRISSGLRATGAELPMLVGALAWELSLLEQIQTMCSTGISLDQAFQRARIWPARQQPMRAVLTRLSEAGLQQCVATLARLDRLSKGQEAGDPWLCLDQLVTDLCGIPRDAVA